jgi:hypothetical protein
MGDVCSRGSKQAFFAMPGLPAQNLQVIPDKALGKSGQPCSTPVCFRREQASSEIDDPILRFLISIVSMAKEPAHSLATRTDDLALIGLSYAPVGAP